MSQIEIVPADGLFRFLAYCRLPRLLYAGMDGFAPPLDVERWAMHSPMLNPHFKLVESQRFLARRDGRWVGRIEAHVYKPEITPVAASRHQFGALDAIDDLEVVRALVAAAEGWLAARGAATIHGPFSPSINHECGLLIEGATTPPMVMTPWHPPYLGALLETLGYGKARDLLTFEFNVADQDLTQPARIANRKEWRDRLKMRPLKLDQLKTGETELMTDLFNDAWSGNWGYVERTRAEFDSDADVLGYVVPAEYGIVVEFDGAPVAFLIALPNLCEIWSDLDGRLFPFGLFKLLSRLRKHSYESARVLLLGTRKSLQSSATGGAILLGVVEEIRRRAGSTSASRMEAGWVLEDNVAMRKPIEIFGGKVDKIHRIYEKRLP